MTYQEKLLDPRWLSKRVEIIDREKNVCQECDRTYPEMHVHHKYYKRDTEPWDYPNDALLLLCDNCHRQLHYFLAEYKGREEAFRRLSKAFIRNGYTGVWLNCFNIQKGGYVNG